MTNNQFPKTLRLTSKKDYKNLSLNSERRVGRLIVIDYKENNLTFTRLGITASRRYGKAHERNRFKRIVREAFRLSYSWLRQGYDINIRPRSAVLSAETPDLIRELQYFLGK